MNQIWNTYADNLSRTRVSAHSFRSSLYSSTTKAYEGRAESGDLKFHVMLFDVVPSCSFSEHLAS